MTTAAALVVVALVAAALGWSVVVRARGGTPAGWSWLRITLGACALVGLVVAGSALIGATPRTPPEQRGIGVLVWPSGGTPVDGLASPITVSVALEVTNCRDRVGVRLTITPAAEFWNAHAAELADGAVLGIAVPDSTLTDVTASLEDDALEATVSPARELSKGKPLSIAKTDATSVPDTTMVTIEVAKWGLTNKPVSLSFDAAWTSTRSGLGSCYVTLPALSGLPTVVSAAELAGVASDEDADLTGQHNLLVVTSQDPSRHAYYNVDYEVTRGVAILSLGESTLDQVVGGSAPDANFGGNNAWTCRSTLTDRVGAVGVTPEGEDIPDLVLAPDAKSYSISEGRMGEILAQRNCASFVAVDESGASTKRDLVLIMIGALFSLGVELFLSGFRRRQAA